MAGVNSSSFRVQHVATTPRGWHVRTKRAGSHELRIAFPPGRRETGAGKVVEILHPKKNPACEEGSCELCRTNPQELVLFGNPQGTPALNALIRKYNELRKAGYSKAGAIDEVVRYALAGPATVAKFKEIASKSNTNPLELVVFGNPRKGVPTTFRGLYLQGTKKKVTKEKSPKPVLSPYRSSFVNPSRRRNQGEGEIAETEQAVALYETFHGKEPGELLEEQRSAAMRSDYTSLGELLAVGLEVPEGWSSKHLTAHWEEAPHISFEGDGVKLASSPNGRQLYAIGGNQDLGRSLDDFDVDITKDLIDLGEAGFVVYLARKAHSNFEPIEWVHEFGEETGARPRLVYDQIKKEIAFAGGEYFIDTSEELSPGIEN